MYRILFLEDDTRDVELMQHVLKHQYALRHDQNSHSG